MKEVLYKLFRFIIIIFMLINFIFIAIDFKSFAIEEKSDNELNMDNDFSTQKLIVETDNIEEIESDENILEIKPVFDDMFIVEYKDEESTKEGYEDLSNNNNIKEVVTNEKIELYDNNFSTYSVSPNNTSWGVEATGLDYYSDYIKYKTNNEVLVAVLDTGIRKTHEAFCEKNIGDRIDTSLSKNYITGSSDITDVDGHGTMVSSIIAESTPSNVKIVPIKVVSSEGGYINDIIEALNDIKDKVDIINMSFGRAENELSKSSKNIFNNIISQIYNNGKGPMLVCAAGNDSTKVAYPASNSYTIAVSSLKENYGRLEFASDFSNYGKEIDFSAPGEFMKLAGYTGDSIYYFARGTSFSAPFVSSAAALIKSENPNFGSDQIKEILKQNVDDLGTYGKDNYYGYGSINFIKKFEKPNIASLKLIIDSLNSCNYVDARAVCADNIVKYACVLADKTVTDKDWITIDNPSTNVEVKAKIDSGDKKIYKIYFMDSEGEVNYGQIDITKIDLDKENLSILEDKSEQLKVTNLLKDEVDNKVIWKSSNSNVATVSSSGVVTGISEGTAVITAVYGSSTAKCTVTVYWNNPFKDVKSSDWEYQAVKYCYKNGYVKGYNETTFAPNQQLTRAEIVTILYRIDGNKPISGKNNFSDVSNNMWYTTPINWAYNKGIIHGYEGQNKFGPNDKILRQDLAGILRNYASYKGKSTNAFGDLTKFSDYKKVSNYALVSMKWAVGSKVITGNLDGTLNPKGNSTRAESISMIYKYLKNIK